MAIIKQKKISVTVSVIDFILGVGIAAVFSVYESRITSFDFSAYLAYIKNYLVSNPFGSAFDSLFFIATFAPLICSFLALFGRLGRFVNILSFASMFFFAAFAVILQTILGSVLFSFSTLYDSCFSVSIISSFLGVLLSLVNLEKSK